MLQDLFPVFGTFSGRQTRASAKSSGQTDSHFIAFRTNPAFKSAHQAKLQGCFPTPTNNAQRELLGNTSPIYTFSETAWNTAQAGFPTSCLSKFSSQGHENCPSPQSTGQQIHSLIRNVKFYAASLFTTIILMQSSQEQANNFEEKFMPSTTLCFGKESNCLKEIQDVPTSGQSVLVPE